MGASLSLSQWMFSVICILFCVNTAVRIIPTGVNWVNITLGALSGLILSAILIGAQRILRKTNLRTFNLMILGLLAGYCMTQVILFSLQAILGLDTSADYLMPMRFLIFIITTYCGLMLTIQSADTLHLSIPFVEFQPFTQKKKDILVDISILSDQRIIDLASSGLLDHHLIMPRFALHELYIQADSKDDVIKIKAKRAIDVLKKLDNLPNLNLRYVDTDFPEIKDLTAKMVRLARFLDTYVITSDVNRIQQASIEGVKIINIHVLSNALKPVMQAGESINIKIQRIGKEARQGIGYLDDGTMVVVNEGAPFIGKVTKAYVLSAKTTSSGRLIFCNAAEEAWDVPDDEINDPDEAIFNSHEHSEYEIQRMY